MTPTAFAYLAVPAHLRPVQREVAAAAAWRTFAAFAAGEGYTLVGLFVDAEGETESGVYQMLEAIRAGQAVAVLVLDPDHLRRTGCLHGADLRTASRYLRARVVLVDQPPR